MNPLWFAQIGAVLRLEMKKTFFARRGLWIYLLAFSPVALYGAHSFNELRQGRLCDFGEDTNIFAGVFQIFYLRLAVYFGCVGIFMNLFRGEMLNKSLHYYFLAPLRREVLLAGKYLAGLLVAIVVFSLSTLVQFAAMYAHYDSNTVRAYLLESGGAAHLAAYLGATVLACIGYGSVFLAAGVLFRNPIVPAGLILVWEAINAFLPAILQKFSVIYYLKSLCPIQIPANSAPPLSLITINVDPMPAYIAVPGLLALAAVVLALASLRVRKMEINYATD
jgi:ABC-type transport system involved in multi-copper enzyme maturation permease subunit